MRPDRDDADAQNSEDDGPAVSAASAPSTQQPEPRTTSRGDVEAGPSDSESDGGDGGDDVAFDDLRDFMLLDNKSQRDRGRTLREQAGREWQAQQAAAAEAEAHGQTPAGPSLVGSPRRRNGTGRATVSSTASGRSQRSIWYVNRMMEGMERTWSKLKDNEVTGTKLGTLWKYCSLLCGSMSDWRDYLDDRLSMYRRLSRRNRGSDATFEHTRRFRMPRLFMLMLVRVVIFLDSCLRGISQVVFADNPVSGLIIMITLFVCRPWVAYTALLGVLSSTLVAEVLDLNFLKYRQGEFGYNGYLVGCALGFFLRPHQFTPPPQFSDFASGGVMLMTVFMSAMSTPLLLSVSHALAPCFTIPFNLLHLITFAGANIYTHFDLRGSVSPQLPVNLPSDFRIDGDIIYHAFFNGVSDIYFMNQPVGGMLVLLAQFITNPLLPLASFLGSCLGVLVAYLLGVPAAEIRNGVWGYNPCLTAMALFTFYRTSWQSVAVMTFFSAFTVLVYAAIREMLRVFGCPEVTFAFCLCSIAGVALKGYIPELDQHASFGDFDLPRISNWKGKRDMRRVRRAMASLSTVEVSTVAAQQHWPQNRMRRKL